MPVDFKYVLHLADNSLIFSQRLSEWCGHAPALEEELALTNIALDTLGQARLLLSLAGQLEGAGRDEDAFAYQRLEHEFLNFTLCELPNTDFAHTMVKGVMFTAWQALLWQGLQAASSVPAELKAIAEKSAKETRYHLQHLGGWLVRLGDGTRVSHDKAQAALNYLWNYKNEWFNTASPAPFLPLTDVTEQEWLALIQPILDEATLTAPADTPFVSRGKLGQHSEHMGHLLAPMQYLARSYPNAVW